MMFLNLSKANIIDSFAWAALELENGGFKISQNIDK